ncbi:MAG: ribonuclease PH [Candidatus Saccharicenans sp.]|nr:ribonuclease PH [Candidatus Saccharicenans sp.]
MSPKKSRKQPAQKQAFTRPSGRNYDELRPILIKPDYLDFAEGSAFIEMGRTRVVATATIEEKVPPFLKGTGTGWITAEYSMLPRSTEKRTPRERAQSSGRTQEIQRLIGRALRATTDLTIIGERTIIIDCDVIQADGGTRTASVNAGCVALALCFKKMLDEGQLETFPLRHLVAAVSVGVVEGQKLLDLDYLEDSQAEVDMNVIQTDDGRLVEIQATAEKKTFSRQELNQMLKLAEKGIKEILAVQKSVLKKIHPVFIAY